MADQQATGGPGRWQGALSVAAAVLVVAAAIFCGVSAYSWLSASGDETVRFAATRDDVLRIGKQELINFYTLDYQDPDASFQRLVDSSTGDLAIAVKQGEATWKKQLTDGRTSSTAKVLDAVVTELDDRAGTATVDAIVEVTVKPDSGKPANRLPMQIELTRTDQGWKLSQAGSIVLGSQ